MYILIQMHPICIRRYKGRARLGFSDIPQVISSSKCAVVKFTKCEGFTALSFSLSLALASFILSSHSVCDHFVWRRASKTQKFHRKSICSFRLEFILQAAFFFARRASIASKLRPQTTLETTLVLDSRGVPELFFVFRWCGVFFE